MKIVSFSGRWRFLSNFYVEPDGSHVEGEFQRAKCAEAYQRRWFHVATDHDEFWTGPLIPPAQCKDIGRKVVLRADWEDKKLEIMEFYVRKKFRDSEELASALLGTGDAHLEEGNTWGDKFWGTVNGKGLNILGQILMQVREELRDALIQ